MEKHPHFPRMTPPLTRPAIASTLQIPTPTDETPSQHPPNTQTTTVEHKLPPARASNTPDTPRSRPNRAEIAPRSRPDYLHQPPILPSRRLSFLLPGCKRFRQVSSKWRRAINSSPPPFPHPNTYANCVKSCYHPPTCAHSRVTQSTPRPKTC